MTWDAVAHGPPLRGRRRSRTVVPAALDMLAKDARNQVKHVRRLHEDGRLDRLDDLERLHDLRKTGRALRHTVDALPDPRAAGLPDKATRRLGKRGARIQSALGDHRDALLLAEHVAATADHAGAEEWAALQGIDLASYRVMVAAAHERAADAVADLPDLLADLDTAARRFTRKIAKK